MRKISSDDPSPEFTDGKDQAGNSAAKNSASRSGLQIAPELKQSLNMDLQTLKILDYIAIDPLIFAFQDKLLNQYRTSIIEPLVQGNEQLQQAFQNFKVNDSITEIKSTAEEVARTHGVKESFAKRYQKINIALIVILLVTFVGVMFIPQLAGYSSYVLLPIMLAFCIIPQFLRPFMQKRWVAISATITPEIEGRTSLQSSALLNFNQELLFHLRNLLLENKIPLQTIQFVLFSSQYQGVNLIEQSVRENRPNYLYQLAYPPGVEPIQVTPVTQYEAVESDEYDEFANLIIKEFDGENILQYTFHYLPREQYPSVNELLDESDFADDQKARDFLLDVNKIDLNCTCGQKLMLKDCQLCNWEKNLDFYFFFATGQKCKCGKTTYVLSAEPKDVPMQLQGIFI